MVNAERNQSFLSQSWLEPQNGLICFCRLFHRPSGDVKEEEEGPTDCLLVCVNGIPDLPHTEPSLAVLARCWKQQLVLASGMVSTACGANSSDSSPPPPPLFPPSSSSSSFAFASSILYFLFLSGIFSIHLALSFSFSMCSACAPPSFISASFI